MGSNLLVTHLVPLYLQLADDYIYKHHHKMFPVAESGKLIGCVSTRQMKGIPREEWARRTVGDIVVHCSEENTIGKEEDAVRALSMMNQTGQSRLMATENGRLAGIIALKDM